MAIVLNKSYWQFLKFKTNLLFNAWVPSKLKTGKQYSGSAAGSSFFSLGYLVVGFSNELLLWYLAAALCADCASFFNMELLVVDESPTAVFSTVLTSKNR